MPKLLRRRLIGLAGLAAMAISIMLPIGCATHGYGPPKGKSPLVFYPGDTTRLLAIMQKARTGKQITIGFIGGSITRGFGIAAPDKCFAGLVRQWWEKRFPEAHITYINAGVDGLNSRLALSRVQETLLRVKPDFVITEFAVNDHRNQRAAESYEQLTQMIFNSESHPAEVLLFMIRNDTDPGNVQDQQIPVGLKYHLPMISFRNWVEPRLLEGKIRWKDFMLDEIHPNDEGHRLAAELIIKMLDEAYNASGEKPAPRPGK
jgi:lysophospholipase L1-like esterase